jgi:muconolactone D-isomerase
MLFLVQMQVNIPHTLDPQRTAALLAEEKAFSQELQRDGRWRPTVACRRAIRQLQRI